MNGVSAVLAAAAAFAVTALLGVVIVPFLKKLKFGQSILDIGPSWHKSKQGTPTMGGLMFIAGIVIAMLLVALFGGFAGKAASQARPVASALFIALAFGFIGFLDDYIKVVKKRNLGLTARQKLLFQLIVGTLFLVIEYISGDQGNTFTVPFWGGQIYLGLFYWPAALLLIVGMVNFVNLTDGIDGLASSVTLLVAIALMICARLAQEGGLAALAAALAGGCLGFLVWNMHPAKVFMGDTGSLFLGGLVCALAFSMHYPLLLVPVGVIYIIEGFSVIIQVISFKTTGKRVFKMSPIHHHYEMCGWSEIKIVTVFSVTTVVFCALTVLWMADYMGALHF